MTTLSPDAVAMLRQCVDDIHKRCGTPEALIRVYVWAVHRGQDPKPALLAKWFGTSEPAALGPGAFASADQWARDIQRTGVAIPGARS